MYLNTLKLRELCFYTGLVLWCHSALVLFVRQPTCLSCCCSKIQLANGRRASTLRDSRGWCEKRRAQNCKDTLRDILHWHYVHIPGKNILFIITYWSFSREKINIHVTNLGICTQHRIKLFFYLYSCLTPWASGTYHPFHFLYHPPLCVGHYPYSSTIHNIALMSAAAFRLRMRRVSILRACATSVSFVLRLFAKTRNPKFFYPLWDFFLMTTAMKPQ
jgi:hypothetical protein